MVLLAWYFFWKKGGAMNYSARVWTVAGDTAVILTVDLLK